MSKNINVETGGEEVIKSKFVYNIASSIDGIFFAFNLGKIHYH